MTIPLTSLGLSDETLNEIGSLLRGPLEATNEIRENQDLTLANALYNDSAVTLDKAEPLKSFYFGCLDFIPVGEGPSKSFHLIELNGTNIGGSTNIPAFAVEEMVTQFRDVVNHLPDTGQMPVFILPYSGSTTHNSLSISPKGLYERALVGQCIKEGFQARYGVGNMIPLMHLLDGSQTLDPKIPTVVIGYFKDCLDHLTVRDGKVYLLDTPVAGAYHDMFLANLMAKFGNEVRPESFFAINSLFQVTSDKGLTYQYANQFLEQSNFPRFARIQYQMAESRDALINMVSARTERGDKIVIKPHATGLGRGVDFFVSAETPQEQIKKIDASIGASQEYYAFRGSLGGFPYTVCDFINGHAISQDGHDFKGHKYELRVMVYRTNDRIVAVPAFVKIASKPFVENSPDRQMLLINVGASVGLTKQHPYYYMRSLCNQETLDLLDLRPRDLHELCRFSTEFVQFLIRQQP